MIITYSRSSSVSNFKFCEMQYYLTYNLGYTRDANKKANQGSAVHKVLEWMAMGSKYIRDNPDTKKVFIEEGLDEVSLDDFYKVTKLTNSEVDAINKSRVSKSIYKCDASINYGHSRMGVDYVTYLINEACKYYSSKGNDAWTKANYKECNNFTWMAVDYNNGAYDPRKRYIKSPEMAFDLKIDRPWAKYSYDIGNETVSGTYGIKGTIDLITELPGGILEIIDWKTGQRYDWATGEIKTYEKLCKDPQLLLYYYAATRLFPKARAIILTIFFIRDGGPFTITFEPEDLDRTEIFLREHFEKVRDTKVPQMCHPDQNDFKCKKLCPFFKEEFDDSGMNTCRFIHKEIKRLGVNEATRIYKNVAHSFEKYQQPGE